MKKTFYLILGMVILLLFWTAPAFCQIYEICFPGNSFCPVADGVDFTKGSDGDFYLGESDIMICHVNFPASANGMKVSRLSLTYLDNNVGGYLGVALIKLDRWSGTATHVASLYSSEDGASPDLKYMNRSKSTMSARGIDNNRYSWFLWGRSTGGSNLKIYQVTIRYE